MEDKREINFFEFIILLYSKLKKVISNLLAFCKDSFFIYFKYFWVSLPILGLFIVFGFYMSSHEKTKYQASGIAIFAPENRLFVEQEFKALNSLKNTDFNRFMSETGLNESQAGKFIYARISYVVDCLNDSTPDIISKESITEIVSDSGSRVVDNLLGVSIYLKGTCDYTPYIEGFIKYFNSQRQLYIVDSISKESVRDRIAFCDTELDRLDRFSEYDYFGGAKQSVILRYNKGLNIEPSRENLYYENMRDLIQERQYLKKYMESNHNVVSFVSTVLEVVSYPRIVKLFLFVLFGALVGVCASRLVYNRRKKEK